MNWEEKKLRLYREAEKKKLGGEEAYRLHALQNLKLKTVVKESHSTTVHALAFNHTDPSLHNLFCTVGKDQATVYNDEHMGEYVGVVVHFTNQASDHAQGGELQACCWLSAVGWTRHPHGDAYLAVAGADTNISVISVVESRVVKLLKGHCKEVVELAACQTQPTLLASLSRDGNVRLWDVPGEACLSSLQADASCIALSPDGSYLLCGSGRGKLFRYDLQRSEGGPPSLLTVGSKQELQLKGGGHSEALDCMRFLPGSRLGTKSVDGRMFVWDLGSLESVAGWKVPSCNPLAGFQGRCLFSSTPDGQLICVGNSTGDCYVYSASSGQRLTHVSAIKVTAPVRACGLSPDCRHLVAAIGKGFLFRYEYLGHQQQQEQTEPKQPQHEEEGKENADPGNGVAGGEGVQAVQQQHQREEGQGQQAQAMQHG